MDMLRLLLADDDKDDCALFKEALVEARVPADIQTVHDGERLPNALFLGLNMPRKNGLECLEEIRQNDKLQHLPVFIRSTSFDPAVAGLLFQKGARHYIRKQTFGSLKKVVYNALKVFQAADHIKSSWEHFVIES
ncbi:MAG: hypothetical protein BGO69_11405 [Bacteroidetes bacterium 46-16]|nr:MAG: hypothetical protein BGO69_11405 [Bacteroidetes bacterium 46-16]